MPVKYENKKRSLFSAQTLESDTDEKTKPSEKKTWNLFDILWKAFKKMCTFLGFMVLVSASISLFASQYFLNASVALPDEMILLFELDQPVIEHDSQISPYAFSDRPYTVRQITSALENAKNDPRVHGFVLSVKGGAIGLSHIQEVRDAVKEFSESGKFAYIYAPSFDGMGNGLGLYYLASAFDEIWMQPMGIISIPGLQAEVPYARDALDKLGITPDFLQRKEYKTLFESFESTQMSPENREVLNAVLNDIGNQIVSDIAKDRGTEPQAFKALMDLGILTDVEALQNGLIDRLGYPSTFTSLIKAEIYNKQTANKAAGSASIEESKEPLQNEGQPVIETVQETAEELVESATETVSEAAEIAGVDDGTEAEDTFDQLQRSEVENVALSFVKLPGYHRSISKNIEAADAVKSPDIALIYAVGGIVQTVDGPSDSSVGADELSNLILNAADDPNIRAIVLRVVSPGGSPTASETIRHAVEFAQDRKGKLVIVSMGDTAASGGYWISADADYIFAMPSTLTGSIGVAGGKFVLRDMWPKLGVNWDKVEWGGDLAGIWSFNEPYSDKGLERMGVLMDHIYLSFIQRVAKGRNISLERADEIARGRVWTGNQALEVGLVDEIGDLNDALDYTASLLGYEDRTQATIAVLPKPKTAFEQIVELLSTQVSMGHTLQTYAGDLEALKPVLETLSSQTDRPMVDLPRPGFSVQ